MNDMSEWKHDIRSLVRRFEQAVNSGYMMNMDDEEIIDLFDYYFEIQDIQKAEMVIDQWGRLFPMDDMRKLCLAKLLTYKEEYSEALSTLDEVMYLDDFELYLYRGYALLGLHRVDEAVEMFNKALELADEADEYRLRYEISVALERNQYGDLAMSFLDKANGLDTKDLVLLNDLISFSFRNGKYEDCISYCNKALDIDPYQKEAWVYQGFAYDSLGNKEKALEALDYAEAISEEVDIVCIRAELLLEMNRVDEAKNLLMQSLESSDDKLPLLKLLAECYEKEQDYERMFKTYSEIVTMEDDESDDSMLVYAYSALASEHYKETIEIADKVLETDPFNEFAMIYKADALFYGYEDGRESKRLYSKVLGIDPENYDAYNGLGFVAFSEEDYKSAIQYFTKAYELSVDNVVCLIYIAASYYNMGDEASMLTYIKKALTLSNDAVSKFFEICPEAFDSMQKYL
jgi:tetratricopeptide (TPR) repeat protein